MLEASRLIPESHGQPTVRQQQKYEVHWRCNFALRSNCRMTRRGPNAFRCNAFAVAELSWASGLPARLLPIWHPMIPRSSRRRLSS